MRYVMQVISNEALPEGNDWAIVEVEGCIAFLCKRHAWTPEVIADAWAAFRRLDRLHTPCRQLPSARPVLQIAR